jgi:hypothetical protein
MKFIIFLGFTLIIVFSPGFQCGRNNRDACINGRQTDTVYTNFTISNYSNVYHIGDSIKFSCKVNDSINSSKGASFTHNRNIFSAKFQPYKVVNNSGLSQLIYANNEFNVLASIGQLQNNGYAGYDFIFQRFQPYNSLQVTFVAGRVGLYLFSLKDDGNAYYGTNYVQKDNDICTGYPNSFAFPVVQQQANYWDTLGVSRITLTNASNYAVADKPEKNYAFIKVIP